ncbi:MAG: toll/interleukin-1 receptor domain-containing protein [Candidatus Competibacteraceae bacterium]
MKLDVYITDVRVAALRFDLNIREIRRSKLRELIKNLFNFHSASNRVYLHQRQYRRVKIESATTAFASYASQDRLRVLDRVAALQISAGMDVFQDCLSLHSGEAWKEKLLQEILKRDLFLLFWSKFAKNSQWVKWEWTTALEKRGEEVIQLHPLDIADEAPPPSELAHLHFGSSVMHIRKSYEAIATQPNP